MVTKSSREMQKDREKIRPPFGGLKFCQGTHYLPLTLIFSRWDISKRKYDNDFKRDMKLLTVIF